MKLSEFKLDDLAGKSLIETLQKDFWANSIKIIELLMPQFTISEIGITHRWVTHWDNQGLIDNRREGTEWRRFSFVEYIWLRIIVRLREFNMPLTAIKQVKKFLWQHFSIADFQFMKDTIVENMKKGMFPKHPDYATVEEYEKSIKTYFSKLAPEFRLINQLFLSLFGMLIHKKPVCLLIDEKGQCSSIFFGDAETTEASIEIITQEIAQADFLCINLYRILEEFFSNEKISDEAVEKFAVLSDKEKQILELIRNGDFEELSIKLKNSREYLVGIKRKKSIDKITNEVSSIISRNKYQDIKLVTQKGKIILAEITEKIKI